MAAPPPKLWTLFDWGGTIMSEEGPLDLPMALWPEVTAIEGAHETLATLSRRYRIGVATNASVSRRNMIEVALGRVGLRDYISDVFCYTEIGARKNSDEFWRSTLERLEAEAEDLAMVGDSLEGDVLAPRSFGIYSVWFNPAGAASVQGVPTIARLPEAIPLIEAHFKARR